MAAIYITSWFSYWLVQFILLSDIALQLEKTLYSLKNDIQDLIDRALDEKELEIDDLQYELRTIKQDLEKLKEENQTLLEEYDWLEFEQSLIEELL